MVKEFSKIDFKTSIMENLRKANLKEQSPLQMEQNLEVNV
jgi:hypothetical protein